MQLFYPHLSAKETKAERVSDFFLFLGFWSLMIKQQIKWIFTSLSW